MWNDRPERCNECKSGYSLLKGWQTERKVKIQLNIIQREYCRMVSLPLEPRLRSFLILIPIGTLLPLEYLLLMKE